MRTNTDISVSPMKYGRGQNPNSRKNLKVGTLNGNANGNGNPNGYSFKAKLKKLLQEDAEFVSPTARPIDKLWDDQIARAILVKAACGDVPMVNTLLDRIEGKVQSDILPVSQDNRVLIINVVSDRAKELVEKIGERLDIKGGT